MKLRRMSSELGRLVDREGCTSCLCCISWVSSLIYIVSSLFLFFFSFALPYHVEFLVLYTSSINIRTKRRFIPYIDNCDRITYTCSVYPLHIRYDLRAVIFVMRLILT